MSFMDLVRCPSCRSSMARCADTLICTTCSKMVSYEGNVADFVDGRFGTALDDIDYDSFYGVNTDASEALRQGLISALGPLWPASFNKSIEIGAGTGYLTLSMLLNETDIDLVVTDVSPKMLGICRARLNSLVPDMDTKTFFATYSGVEDFVSAGSFKVCFGSSVIHHILDVEAFLDHARRLLADDGVAFFLEPNLDYNNALAMSLAETVSILLSDGEDSSNTDIIIAANWVCEVQQNISHLNDVEFLATREDKHMFSRRRIAALSAAAGFEHWDAFPFAHGRSVSAYFRAILAQIGISSAMVERMVALASPMAERRLAQMAPRDICQSYVIFFSKVRVDVEGSEKFGETRKRVYLSLTPLEDKGSIVCNISGWAVASKAIADVRVVAGASSVKLPLTQARLDVQQHINNAGEFPAAYALCSGFSGSITFPASSNEMELRFELVGADGSQAEFARVPVEPPFGVTKHLDIG